MPAPVRPAPALPVPALPAPALAAPAAPADQVPVGFADGHDPGTLRRRDPGRAWAHERGVATGGEAPDGVAPVVRSTDGVAPSPAVLGVPRRVPGATLAEMVGEPGRHARPPDLHQPSPSVASPEQIDPEQARRDVEQVDAAVARARDGVRASVPRRVPGAALDGLHGLRGVRQTSAARDLDAEAVRRSLDEVDAAVERSRSVAAAQPSIADERAADERPADERPADGWHPPQAPDLPRRRVPGATLAALEDGGPRGGLSATPESPQAVLDWVNDLETAQPFAQEWADHDQENTDE
jgi:hypothetical protein